MICPLCLLWAKGAKYIHLNFTGRLDCCIQGFIGLLRQGSGILEGAFLGRIHLRPPCCQQLCCVLSAGQDISLHHPCISAVIPPTDLPGSVLPHHARPKLVPGNAGRNMIASILPSLYPDKIGTNPCLCYVIDRKQRRPFCTPAANGSRYQISSLLAFAAPGLWRILKGANYSLSLLPLLLIGPHCLL